MHYFHAATRSWFERSFTEPTPVQSGGWPLIASGAHALLIAPTGSGKTLAAFLAGIDALAGAEPPAAPGVRLLYVSPLKALVYDVERNLRGPLAGILRERERRGLPARELRVDIRTGDTPAREREAQRRRPGEILVTTPESLYLLLGSRYRENLRGVRTVIVDEVHALAGIKRGAHLALSLERLAEVAGEDPQRVGLSATIRPAEEAARFLGGDRPLQVVDCSAPPGLDLQVVVPVPDMERVPEAGPDDAPAGGNILGGLYAREVGTPPPERGIWSAIYPRILELILANRSTIVFVNSRGLCERLAQRLNELAGEELVRAHHGSVSHESRADIEEGLKRGDIRAIVATSSLELGIDMGAVDQVLQVESPGAVARGLQRIGRAGHHVGAVSKGRIFPKFKGDLLESAVIARRMLEGAIEPTRVPANALDVLAQQVVAMVCDRPRSPAEIGALARRAHPYRELSEEALLGVLEMLCGHYPSEDFADLRPRLAWDRTEDRLSARRGAPMVARLNAGTIPDRGLYAVHLGEDGPRVGELDEEMVFETRAGDRIMLGASTWQVEGISRDRVIVSPAPGEPGRLPFWRGEGPGRPLELGLAIGELLRELEPLGREAMVERLARTAPLDPLAASNLADYVLEQKAHAGALPTDRAVTVERFRDELGDWRVCVLTPFGARVHAPWAMAVQRKLESSAGFEVQVMYTDDGIVVRLADTDEPPALEAFLPDPDELRDLVVDQLGDTALFAGLFRENASRALLITRRRPGQRSPLWAQRQKARSLLSTVRKYPGFPIVLETYRQALAEIFDLPALEALLRRVRSRAIRVDLVETASASPFARSLVFAYVAAYIYDQDSPLAERRAQALTLDRNMLAELLGQAELRELLDGGVIDTVHAELQGLAENRLARDADEVHDLLRRLGDLSPTEVEARCTTPSAAWLAELERARRAVRVQVGEVPRWIAAEDAGLFRDALGAMPPAGLPEAFIAPVEDALVRLVRRYARVRGPFTTAELAMRYALAPAAAEAVLRLLEGRGDVVHGELRPGGATPEWCDSQVLRQLKRRTLAHLRNTIAAVDASALGRFLPAWQGVGEGGRGIQALEDALARLEGLALPWSTLTEAILPARVADFSVDMLDVLCATGRIAWVGVAPLGARDGRIAIYRRANLGILLEAPETVAATPEAPDVKDALRDAILTHLQARGASFLTEIEDAARTARPDASGAEVGNALWDLVWAGRVSNDTFAPLRGLGGFRSRRERTRHPGSLSGGALAGGRWSLVPRPERTGRPGPDPGRETEVAVMRARLLLERYGVVSREAAAHEGSPGGFAPLYKTLRAMEDTGRVRRGYFVEGLSGAQFAPPGAVDRLRAAAPAGPGAGRRWQAEDVLVLAAVDPANPYGALLPWPRTPSEALRPRRAPGAWVLMIEGRAILYVAAGGRALLSFPDAVSEEGGELEAALAALGRIPRRGRRRLLVVERIDERPALESALCPLMLERGFVRDYRGLSLSAVPGVPVAPGPPAV